jgi:hypothetical protein
VSAEGVSAEPGDVVCHDRNVVIEERLVEEVIFDVHADLVLDRGLVERMDGPADAKRLAGRGAGSTPRSKMTNRRPFAISHTR